MKVTHSPYVTILAKVGQRTVTVFSDDGTRLTHKSVVAKEFDSNRMVECAMLRHIQMYHSLLSGSDLIVSKTKNGYVGIFL